MTPLLPKGSVHDTEMWSQDCAVAVTLPGRFGAPLVVPAVAVTVFVYPPSVPSVNTDITRMVYLVPGRRPVRSALLR